MTPVTASVDQRIAERRREVRGERRRRRLRRTLTVLGLLVVLGVGYAIERSPLVELSEIRVEGTARIDPGEVLAVADLPLGTSTLRLDLAGAEARLEALPLVREAEASRVDPLTVRIVVHERAPVLVAAAGRASVLIDPEGVVIAPGRVEGLPVIVLPATTTLPAPGEEVAARPGLGAAFAIYRRLPTAILLRVARLAAHGPDDVDLLLDGGVQVRFGRASRIDEKVRALEAVLADVEGVAVTSIDVRAPATPVVRS